jgi:hypothetical protein
MAEIKSTLDLIMEKTKNLTLTPEEKENLRREEWLKKVRGWITKYLDGQVEMDWLKKEWNDTGKPERIETGLKEELIGILDPDSDNKKLFALLEELLGLSRRPFEDALQSYQREVASEKEQRSRLLKEELARQGLSGAAVLPNLNADPDWRAWREESRRKLKEKWQATLNKTGK